MYIRRQLMLKRVKMTRFRNTNEQNRQYDAVYHLRNRKKRNVKSNRRANAEE